MDYKVLKLSSFAANTIKKQPQGNVYIRNIRLGMHSSNLETQIQ